MAGSKACVTYRTAFCDVATTCANNTATCVDVTWVQRTSHCLAQYVCRKWHIIVWHNFYKWRLGLSLTCDVKCDSEINHTFRVIQLSKAQETFNAVTLRRAWDYVQVEAEAELRDWQGFRGWAGIWSHAETTDHSRKLASALVCRLRRSGHVTRPSAWLIPQT